MAEPAAPSPDTLPVAHLRLKVAALLVFIALLLASAAVYLLYARGAFEATQQLVLVADDSEGVVVGMDLTFSGFPIGRVRRIELAPDGNARIVVEIPRKDAHWLRTSSVFTLQRGFLGNTSIRAYSGILTDPALPDEAVRQVLKGDATAEIPRMVATVRELVQNVVALTAQDAALNTTLTNLREVSDALKGPRGALGVMLGNEADTRKVIQAIENTNRLLARVDQVAARTDGLLARTDALMARADQIAGRADEQVLGKDGLVAEMRGTVTQLNQLLGSARASLQKVDAVLLDAQTISGNAKAASTDLGALRSEIESNLRKIEGLLDEVNRKWPFARDTQVKLP